MSAGEVTDEMVEAMRPFIAELEDAWDQWKDGNVKAVLHKMLTAALAVRGETK